MDTKTAKNSVGELVMTYDPGHKMIPRLCKAHGPYKLLQITRQGLAILEGYEEFRVPPSLIEKYKEENEINS